MVQDSYRQCWFERLAFALVAKLARFGFFATGFVIRIGPMAAVGAEMPGLAMVSAAIGSGHSVYALSEKIWANFRALGRLQTEN